MAREEERDPERREAAARASSEEEEEGGEEGLSDSDGEGDDEGTGSGQEEGEEEEAAAGWERSEDARLLQAGLPPAAVLAAAARDTSGRCPPGPPSGRPRMPLPGDEDRARRRRRRRRRDLLLSQLCFLASVALLLWSLSSLREQKGECWRCLPRVGAAAPRARGGCGRRGRVAGSEPRGPAGRVGGRGAGRRTAPCPPRGSRQDPSHGEAASTLGRLAAQGTITCANAPAPFPQVGGSRGGDLTLPKGAGGSYPAQASCKASNKVVLVRFSTCAGNHLYTLAPGRLEGCGWLTRSSPHVPHREQAWWGTSQSSCPF
jgi:hypothetical protein